MQYPSRKQSWLDFINESMGSYIKNEALDRPMNGGPSTAVGQSNHPFDLNSKSLYQTSSVKRSTTNINHKQQQHHHHRNDLENGKSKFPYFEIQFFPSRERSIDKIFSFRSIQKKSIIRSDIDCYRFRRQ